MSHKHEETIRTAIAAEMARRNLTQSALAAVCQTSRAQVSLHLGGKRGTLPDTVLSMLDALDLEVIVQPKQKTE